VCGLGGEPVTLEVPRLNGSLSRRPCGAGPQAPNPFRPHGNAGAIPTAPMSSPATPVVVPRAFWEGGAGTLPSMMTLTRTIRTAERASEDVYRR